MKSFNLKDEDDDESLVNHCHHKLGNFEKLNLVSDGNDQILTSNQNDWINFFHGHDIIEYRDPKITGGFPMQTYLAHVGT